MMKTIVTTVNVMVMVKVIVMKINFKMIVMIGDNGDNRELKQHCFERCTSTGSEPFSLLVRLYATVFVLPSVLILIETICPKICSKSRLKCAKSSFPVDV